MGVPCCITADPGGEEPPGGKKTWAIAPEGIQGLALAIQSPVCWLSEALSIHSHKNMPKGKSFKWCVWSHKLVHTLTHGHTHKLRTESWVPLCAVSTPFQWKGRNPYLVSGVFPPLSHFVHALAGWLLLLSGHDEHEQCVWESHKIYKQCVECECVCVGGRLPSCSTFFPLSPLSSKEVVSAGEKVQTWLRNFQSLRKKKNKEKKTMPNFVVLQSWATKWPP